MRELEVGDWESEIGEERVSWEGDWIVGLFGFVASGNCGLCFCNAHNYPVSFSILICFVYIAVCLF